MKKPKFLEKAKGLAQISHTGTLAQIADSGVFAQIADSGVLARISDEVKANFAAWYERNFRNGRAGRIGDISYARAGALDDHPGDKFWYVDAYERALLDHTEPLTFDECHFLLQNPLVAFQIAVGISDLRGLRCFRRGLTQQMGRLQRKSYRSRYYADENARRRLHLAEERRKIVRRSTTARCPTPAEFREAFAHVGDSVEAKIRFGGMVHDLECYVDNRLRIDASGEIVGRNRGIRGWILDNVRELAPRYKTIMRYKALAIRIRQATGTKDPVPTSALLDALPSEPLRTCPSSPLKTRPSALRSSAQPGPHTPQEACKNLSADNSHNGALKNFSADCSHGLALEVLLRNCPNTMRACFAAVEDALERTGKG